MKTFKLIDCIFQILLIAAAIVGSLIGSLHGYGSLLDNEFFFVGYFVVGGWQIISVIIHFFAPKEFTIKSRRVYLWLLLITVAAGLLLLAAGDTIIFYLLGLLFWAPVLAIIYLVTCITETQMTRRQPVA